MAKKQTKKSRPMGRPTKFNAKLARHILELAQAGKTPPQIAEALSIAESTLYLWRATKPDFSQAFDAARCVADELVEIALFQRAVGYRHPAVKIHFTERGEVCKEEYTEVYPPDITAAKFWLQNRRPKRWRDVQKHEHSGKVTLEDLVAGEDKEGEME